MEEIRQAYRNLQNRSRSDTVVSPGSGRAIFSSRRLGRCLPCPGPVCTSCLPDLGAKTGKQVRISKTKHFTMYLCWEAKAVFQGGWFLILIFSHVQPIKYMVIMSDKLEFTVIDSMLLKTK